MRLKTLDAPPKSHATRSNWKTPISPQFIAPIITSKRAILSMTATVEFIFYISFFAAKAALLLFFPQKTKIFPKGFYKTSENVIIYNLYLLMCANLTSSAQGRTAPTPRKPSPRGRLARHCRGAKPVQGERLARGCKYYLLNKMKVDIE